MSVIFLLAGSGGLLVVTAAALRWRWAVWTVLILAVYEGAIRKWLLPGLEQEVFFLKDAILLGAYIGFLGASRRRPRGMLLPYHPANILLLVSFAICLLGVLNPRLPSPLVGLFGLQGYAFYIPLMYMVPELLPDERSLRRFVVGVLIVSVIPLALGPIQFSSPADSVINRYAHQDSTESVATFGSSSHARITGTFPYITGYTIFLTILCIFLGAMVMFAQKSRLRLLLSGMIGIAFVDILMSGSRTPVVTLMIFIPLMVFVSLRTGYKRDVKVALASVVLIAVFVTAIVLMFPEASKSFLERAKENDDGGSRVGQIVTSPATAIGDAGLVGFGTGCENQALISNSLLTGDSPYERPYFYEGEFERIILEIGPLGFLVIFIARILLSVHLWKAFRINRNPALRPFLAAALFITLAFFNGNVVYNHSLGILYWFVVGFAFLPGMDSRQGMCRINESQYLPSSRSSRLSAGENG